MANFLSLCLLWQHLDGPIVTDRPDFTESSQVVPHRRFQLESGATSTWDDVRFEAPELLLRYGVAPGAELRAGLPGLVLTDGRRETGPTYLGAKFELGQFGANEAALIPGVQLPHRGQLEPEISATWAAGSLAGMFTVSAGMDRPPSWGATLTHGFPVGPCNGFVEFAAEALHRERPAHIVHAGVTYQPSPDRQWDVHFGLGLSSPAPRAFVGMGYCVRF